MNLKRTLGRVFNRMVRPLNVELTALALDFEERLTSERHLDLLFEEVGKRAGKWLGEQTLFKAHLDFDPVAEAKAFFDVYLRSPYRAQSGGSRFGNLFWLRLIAKAQRPDLIVDSGTFTGASAWALSQGAPQAKIYSFDIDLSRLLLKVPGVTYRECDWTKQPLDYVGAGAKLFYFDDHVDQGLRLSQAAERAGELCVFDDDFDILSFVPMAHGGHSLPKISFILDDRIRDGERIEWTSKGQTCGWTANRAELQRLRSLIAGHDRLPDLSAPAGIWQLPYRVVAMACHA